MRLVDADALIERINEIYKGYMTDECGCTPYDFERIVDEQPTAYEVGVIEFISDKLIYPLLDECDRGLWEHLNYIELAEEWIKILDDNPYPKVKNYNEARKRDLRQWIVEQLKEQKND